MSGELFPFETLIIVDIDLSKQLDEVLNETNSVPGLRQMDEHDLDELLHGKSILLFAEILLDFLQFTVVKMTHDVIVFIVGFIKVFVFF